MGELGLQLVDEMRALSPGRRIEINIVGDVKGEWDRSRMGQVFSNLIGNAIQYGRDTTDVVVSVADYKQQVLISVHNAGDPIPADKLGTVFDSMVRGRASGSDANGSTHLGLGLYITKKIVAAHGGEISVKSTADSGTTFTVLLPR
jgi:signal transduction histidine kinase